MSYQFLIWSCSETLHILEVFLSRELIKEFCVVEEKTRLQDEEHSVIASLNYNRNIEPAFCIQMYFQWPKYVMKFK